MTISIVGSGAIGFALAGHFAEKGIPVTITNTRGASSLAPLVNKLGPKVTAANLSEALQADMVILAVPFTGISDLADKAKWSGRIVVDATNAVKFPEFTPADLGGKLSSAVVAEVLAGARVVKAFNTLFAAILEKSPEEAGGRRVIFLSGEDADARKTVGALIDSLGFAPIDLGSLDVGSPQQFGGSLAGKNLLLKF